MLAPDRTFLRGAARHWLAALVCIVASLGLATTARAQASYQYTTTASGAITDNNCGTAAQIVRNFTVAPSYTVGDVNLGVFLSHTYRSDLRITLRSPAGTTVTVLTWTGNVQSGDHLNDLFDDEAAAAITTHNATVIDPLTPAPPPYSHSFQPSNPLSAFDGQNAAGTWTMTLCDGVASDTGTFTRADLYISNTNLSVQKTSQILTDGINATNPKFIPGATVRYCLLVTNPSVTGTAAASVVNASDALPAGMTLLPASLRSGTTCAAAATVEDVDTTGADETDPFGMSVTGTTVSGSAAALAAGTTFAMTFDATVN